MLLDTLAECVGEPGEPPHPHPHREVVTFHVGRVRLAHVRVALDAPLLDVGAHGRAVPTLVVLARLLPVFLDDLSEVHVTAERALYRFLIDHQSIGGNLRAVLQATTDIVHERQRGLAVPLPADEV